MTLPPRLQKEFDTIKLMVELYCSDHHGEKKPICSECTELLDYASKRLLSCPFQEHKTTCGKCSVHCYKKDMRRKVVDVMRYSGPKMIWKHPVKAIRHLFDSRRKTPSFTGKVKI